MSRLLDALFVIFVATMVGSASEPLAEPRSKSVAESLGEPAGDSAGGSPGEPVKY